MKIKVLIACAVLTLCSACNKWLDVDLINQVDENKLFEKEQGFVDALAGVYSQMSGSSLYGGTLGFEVTDVLAQYYDYNGLGTEYRYYRDYDYEQATVKSKIASIWSSMYANVAALNNILRWEQKNGQVMSADTRLQVKGEALALRAYLHFDLYRMFCADMKFNPTAKGIPYNKEFGVALPPQYTAAEIMQLVIDDLQEAQGYLAEGDPIRSVVPYQLKNVGKDLRNSADKYVARMNLYGVKALLARVYMTQGDKVKAAAMAKEVIESGKFRLLDFASSVDVQEDKKDFRFSDEHIFSLRSKNIVEYSKSLHFDVPTQGGNNLAKLPLVNSYTIYEGITDDVRYQFWTEANKLHKYVKGVKDTEFYPKIPMIKLSEMYLITAEALYDIDRSQSIAYVNTLRKARIRNAPDWFFINREILFKELKKEYLGEGQLFYAYKRLNRDIESSSGAGDIQASNGIFVFPIPDKEIESGGRQ